MTAPMQVEHKGAGALALTALYSGLLALTGQPVQAQSTIDLKECTGIAAADARLVCYDKLAARDAMVALPASPALKPQEAAGGASAGASAVASSSAPGTPAGTGLLPPATSSNSLMSRYWELADADKRGTFNYTAYRPNFFMPLRTSSHQNSRPYTPTQGYANNQPDYQRLETKVQLSLRTKVIEDGLFPGADLWVGYTQESNWQLYNRGNSAPFRNTDYQPEAIFVVPTPKAWQTLPLGWRWRMSQLGFVHQSNGQVDPLSRSWNRFYLGLGVEHGDLAFLWRTEHALDRKNQQDNNNPDIVDYLGRQQWELSWTPGRSTMALLWRPSLRGRGSLRADWTYPVFNRPTDSLRWYVQLFSGYGDSLLDYNFHQTTLGLGLSIFKF
jgi:phospholipase A1/A2